jgi:16S rRNA (cytosine1407-C5)-methyltransferase
VQNVELDNYLQNLFGKEKENFLNAPAESKAIRINSLKISREEFLYRMNSRNVDYQPLPFYELGLELINDPLPLSHTIDFFLGYFQYQGISSQIPALVLNPKPGEKVLDIAAAPGSKSTQLAALMQNEGELYLNDISHGRLQPLNVNAQRAGLTNHVIMNLAGERYGSLFPEYFDKILVDAPCTALGTLATNPEVIGWWSLDKLNKLCVSQRQLLISAVKTLKPGGELVYSTCSVTPEENEVQIQWLIENYPVEILDIPLHRYFPSIETANSNFKFCDGLSKSIRIFPHVHDAEGFFVIRLRKTDSIPARPNSKKMEWIGTQGWDDSLIKNELLSISAKWGIDENIWADFRYIRTRNRIWMMSPAIERVLSERFQNAGLLLGENKLRGWKLTNQSVQFLNRAITKRKIELEENALIDLFAHGTIPFKGTDSDYYALEWDNTAIASVYMDNDTIKLRLPHSFRLRL